MKVLLVNPGSISVYSLCGLSPPPMGLLSIAASMEQAGHQVRVRDMDFRESAPTRGDFAWADVVGITSDTTRIAKAARIAAAAARAGKRVVVGGPHAQFEPDALLESGDVSFIVRGEGDTIMPRLAKTLEAGGDPSTVPGIIFRRDGRSVATAPAPPVDVEALPFPARHLVDLRLYRATMAGRPSTPVVTSRGCPGGCVFCSATSFFGRNWRARSADSVLAELDEVCNRHGFGGVFFTDDNFTLAPKRVIAIAEGILAGGYDLKWWNFSRIDTILSNPDMVEAMAAGGCYMVSLGIESARGETVSRLGKNIDAGDAARAIHALRSRGIEVYGSYILGAPDETKDDVLRTIELAVRLNTDIAQFTILTPYPGTASYDELGNRIFTRRWKRYDGLHLVFRHPKIRRHRLQQLLLKAYLDFYRRSRASAEGARKAFRRTQLSPARIAAAAFDFFL